MLIGTRPYGLSPSARATDSELARIDGELDWLYFFMPTNVAEVEQGFIDSGCKTLPDVEYPDIDIDLEALRGALLSLPIHDIDDPLLETLLIEKQREIDRQIELIRMRGREGIAMASIDLFGSVGDRMLERAEKIMAEVPDLDEPEHDCDCDQFHAAAAAEMERLRAKGTDFNLDVVLDPNEGTGLFTQDGNLHIPTDYTVSCDRMTALIQHEIGTHSVTRHNGSCQPLRTLEFGLTDYDVLQEGLAVLAEYLCGFLPPRRLRLLAARVIAADRAVKSSPAPDIYACLREEHGLAHEPAFQTMLRAVRGGCFTKDALYLKGLVEVVAYFHHGGDIETLFIGKFAMKQLPTLEKLLERGLLKQPDLLPTYLENSAAMKRLETVRTSDIVELYQEVPAL